MLIFGFCRLFDEVEVSFSSVSLLCGNAYERTM